MKPPYARKDPKSFDIHGITIVDEYHYMREKDTDEVLSYLKAENSYTEQEMRHTLPLQEELFKEMKHRLNETDETYPYKMGNYYYYSRTEEGKNYKIYCRKTSLDGEEQVILDVNELAAGHEYCSVGDLELNHDHSLLLYSVDFSGYETYDVMFKDLKTGKLTDEKIASVSGSLLVIGEYLYYNELDNIHRSYTVMRHKIGSDQSEDVKLYEETDNRFFVGQYKSLDNRFLFVIANGPDTQTIYYLDLQDNSATLTPFQKRVEGEEYYVDYHEGKFYFSTNRNAKNFKLCITPIDQTSEENWETLLEHDPNRLVQHPICFKDHLVVFVRQGGFRSIKYMPYSDAEFREIDLPEKIYGISSHEGNQNYDAHTFRFYYSSLVTPSTDFELDLNTGKLKSLKVTVVNDYDPSNYVTERLNATAKDGTLIPISVAYRKGTKLDGSSPLLLYGYGSYGASIDPYFSLFRMSLIDRGFIYCIAHIRGGGELGRLWYEQGKLANKMNTFTDFIASAEYLIEKKYTSKDKIAIWGGSAGGLLIGATINLRPDLFKAAIAQVPFVDVINTMLDDTIPLTTFEYKEWGNPNIEEEFKWMYEYSPYDNVKEREYPNLLITGGLNDPRVHVWEPAKWGARLRDHWKGDNKLLMKINMGAGHAGASGRYDYMKEIAFYYAFLLDQIKN